MNVWLIVLHLQRTKIFMLMKNKTTIFYLAFIVFISFCTSINTNAICYRKYVDTCKDNDISINVVLVPIDIKNGSTGNGNHRSPFRNPIVSIIRNQLLLYGRWGRCTLQIQTKNKELVYSCNLLGQEESVEIPYLAPNAYILTIRDARYVYIGEFSICA